MQLYTVKSVIRRLELIINLLARKTLPLLAATIAGYSLFSYADDTEVYFSDINKQPKPNVIFLLDTSGSMIGTINGYGASGNTDTTKPRLASLKEAVETIMANKDVKDLRMGVLQFSDNTKIRMEQEVVDIDEIDDDADIAASDRTSINANTTILKQRLLSGSDDGMERWGNNFPDLKNNSYIYVANNALLGFRFANILLKKPSEVGITDADKGIKKAELSFRLVSRPGNSSKSIDIYLDPAINASHLNSSFFGDFTQRIQKSTQNITINYSMSNLGSDFRMKLDVTELIRGKINQADWQSGNAIAFILAGLSGLNIIPTENITKDYRPYLTLEVDNRLIAKNKRTKREKVMDAIAGFTANGGTYIVSNLLAASQYISDINGSLGSVGPYHNPVNYKSPLIDDCQMSHIVLMSDGRPEGDGYAAGSVKSYIGQYSTCRIFNGPDKSTWVNENSYRNTNENCGRALASWMARTSHATIADPLNAKYKSGAFVRTHTIGFAMRVGSSEQKFLEDLADAGQGIHRTSADTAALIKAFQKIIENALLINKPSASGTVTLSPQNGFDQRPEVFYSLYKSESYDYWSGNMKGFKMIYRGYKLTNGKQVERAILADWQGTNPVINDGGTFRENLDTAWSVKDSGDMTKGGVVDQLSEPASRKVYTTTNGSLLAGTALMASSYGAGITDDELKVTIAQNEANPSEKRKLRGQGLLDFIRGFTYKEGGSDTVSPKKIGDSANNGVTLVSYGCDDTNKRIMTCNFNQLHQVALLATNDGILRGYELRTGKNIFEFMPKQMLPLIDKLQTKKGLNINKVRSYGLDGQVAVYHDDKNNNGYIDKGESAYAIVVSGRGGSSIYGIDISNESSPQLKWTITHDTNGFAKLGKTWSVPAVGKVKLNTQVDYVPIMVFGGGYDESQDTNPVQHEDSVGNALYVVNPTTGELLWSTSENMNYSIPGDVALLTDNTPNHLVTDIFFGDMGGQLWRFSVVNGVTNYADMFVAGGGDKGIVASISGSDEATTRRFYQKPMIYKFTGNLANYISVNIGTGYKAHPLVKNNEDRFYSFRFPLKASITDTTVIKDSDLPNANPTDTTTELNITKGFKVPLAQETSDAVKGEKIVSNAFAGMDRLVFNTYIPYVGEKASSCYPIVGTQRTYYFSLSKGFSLLKTGFTEVTPSTLPLDVVAYCNANYCSIISSMNELSDSVGEPNSKLKLVDAQFFEKNEGGLAKKTTWTDLFSPAVIK